MQFYCTKKVSPSLLLHIHKHTYIRVLHQKGTHKIGSLSKQQIEKKHDIFKIIGMTDQRFKRGNGKSHDEVIPKLKPYVAIKALLTRIIPTDVTTLNSHDAASMEAFLSPLLTEDMLN